jgi:lysyl-tRNA synthetase class 2
VLAAAFGSGVALVLDEFALVFRLQDVYWSTEGRSSVDAVVISTVLGGVLLLHLTPTSDARASSRWALTAAVTLNLVLVLIAALKGRFLLATIGVFVWVFAWIGAIRLGKPTSIWARWRYKPDSRKHRRAEERDARYRARWVPRKDRLLDLIGGAPSDPEHR